MFQNNHGNLKHSRKINGTDSALDHYYKRNLNSSKIICTQSEQKASTTFDKVRVSGEQE